MCKKRKYDQMSNPRIDKCMKPLIKWLNKHMQFKTVASCCGHGKYPMTVIITFKIHGTDFYHELLSVTHIPRRRNFYKRDKQGYYYIPEVV